MWSTIDDHLLGRFRSVETVRRRTPEIEAAVRSGTMTAAAAAAELLDLAAEPD